MFFCLERQWLVEIAQETIMNSPLPVAEVKASSSCRYSALRILSERT